MVIALVSAFADRIPQTRCARYLQGNEKQQSQMNAGSLFSMRPFMQLTYEVSFHRTSPLRFTNIGGENNTDGGIHTKAHFVTRRHTTRRFMAFSVAEAFTAC